MSRRKTDEIQPDFESSISELEKIVASLENESLSLEQMISAYERGNSLLKFCDTTLKSARQRLEKISNRETSIENGLAFEANMNHDTPTAKQPNEHDDTISLF